jgi:hypothetical protein
MQQSQAVKQFHHKNTSVRLQLRLVSTVAMHSGVGYETSVDVVARLISKQLMSIDQIHIVSFLRRCAAIIAPSQTPGLSTVFAAQKDMRMRRATDTGQ